jgi:hypothetical protein
MMRGQDSRIRIEGSATPKLLAAVFSLVLLGVAATSAGQVANLNGVRYASAFAGTDGGEKLSACMADLPAGGGVCDLRGLEGAQTVSSTVSLNKPLRLDFLHLQSVSVLQYHLARPRRERHSRPN